MNKKGTTSLICVQSLMTAGFTKYEMKGNHDTMGYKTPRSFKGGLHSFTVMTIIIPLKSITLFHSNPAASSAKDQCSGTLLPLPRQSPQPSPFRRVPSLAVMERSCAQMGVKPGPLGRRAAAHSLSGAR